MIEHSGKAGRIVVLVLLAVALYFSFRIIRPYLQPILLAVILAPLLHPVSQRIARRLRGRQGAAALVTCVLLVVVLLGPTTLLVSALIGQGLEVAAQAQAWVEEGGVDEMLSNPAIRDVQPLLQRYLPFVDPARLDLRDLMLSLSTRAGGWLLARGGALLSGTGALLGQLLLMLFVLFYLLRDGNALLAAIGRLSPLRSSQQTKLVERFRSVSRSAIVGSFATAAAQGLAGGIGLALVGIPALFWGSVMALASFIPVIGTTLVWGPACIYLLLAGSWGKALFLAAYCAVVVGSIDNFLRPVLMQGEAGMSTLWVFFSILGGLQSFGLLGLIYGPVIFGLLAVLLSLYEDEFREFLVAQKSS